MQTTTDRPAPAMTTAEFMERFAAGAGRAVRRAILTERAAAWERDHGQGP